MKNSQTISLCMITKNEEKLLAGCIESVRSIVDEIIVIDTGSKDKTVEIAKSCGAKVHHFKWIDDYRAARNEYLKWAKGDWILALDGDERISSRDHKGLLRLTDTKKVIAYNFPVRNYTCDSNVLYEWHPLLGEYPELEMYSGYFIVYMATRLFRNIKNLRYDGCLLQPNVGNSILEHGGKIKTCCIPIHHLQQVKRSSFEAIKEKQLKYLALSKKSLCLYPKNALMHYNAGQIYFTYLNEYDSAVRHIEKAIALRSDYARGYWLLSLIYQKQGKFKKAEAVLKKVLKAAPRQRHMAYCLLGLNRLKQFDLPAAKSFLNKSTTLNAYNPVAYNLLGTLYALQKDAKRAIMAYKKAIAINKFYSEAVNNLNNLKESINNKT